MEALRFLKQHNPEYKDVIISEEQAALYHENGIMQPSDGIPTIDPEQHNIPPTPAEISVIYNETDYGRDRACEHKTLFIIATDT